MERTPAAERLGSLALVGVLIVAGVLAWALALRPALVPDPEPLSRLPQRIAGMRAQDLPVESQVERILRADHNVQRVYRHPTGGLVWLYVGYYGTARGGRPEHTPQACYTGAGWRIERKRVLEVAPGSALRVNEYLVRREEQTRLVHFWFKSFRSTGMVSPWHQHRDRLLGRLISDRADGALVRLSTPLHSGEEIAARSRLLGFAAEVDPLLSAHWPGERPEES